MGIAVLGVGAGFAVNAGWRLPATAVATEITPHFMPDTFSVPVVKVFDDFQCPACARFDEAVAPRLEELQRQGRLRLMYMHAPISSHRKSRFAAAAVACADPGDRRTARQRLHADLSWTDDANTASAVRRVAGLGFDTKWASCMDSDSVANVLTREEHFARRVGVNSVPTVWVNDVHVRFRTYPALLRYIEDLL